MHPVHFHAEVTSGLRRLRAPEHDAEALASVLEDPQIADFDVTTLVNQPHHVVGEAIADFYGRARRDDLTLLYFTGHGVKDAWQHRTGFVAGTRWWPPFCAAVDFVAAALLAVALTAGAV